MSSHVDDSFTRFVAERSGRLVAQATLMCGDHQQAQDIVQTVLARAYPRWRRIERGDPYAYMVTAVTNAGIDWWRRAHRRHEQPAADLPDSRGVALDSRFEDRQVLSAAMETLTGRERAVVVLRYVEDLSERATAEMLGVSTGTIKTTAHRALTKMRRALGDSPEATDRSVTARSAERLAPARDADRRERHVLHVGPPADPTRSNGKGES